MVATRRGHGWHRVSQFSPWLLNLNRLRNHFSHLVGGSFLARKAACALSGRLSTENAAFSLPLLTPVFF